MYGANENLDQGDSFLGPESVDDGVNVGSKRMRENEDDSSAKRARRSHDTTQPSIRPSTTVPDNGSASTIRRTDTGSTAVASNPGSQAGTSRTVSVGSNPRTFNAAAGPSNHHTTVLAAASSDTPSRLGSVGSTSSEATTTSQEETPPVATLVPQALDTPATNFEKQKPIIVVSLQEVSYGDAVNILIVLTHVNRHTLQSI